MSDSSASPTGLKEIEPVGYIGIDFGTSNTHFAYANVEGPLVAEPIRLGNQLSQATCLLWREPALAEEDIVTFGTLAAEEWAIMGSRERCRHRFVAGFKPDLVHSERARRDAWAFLRKCCLNIKDSGVVRTVGAEVGMPVMVGVPAEVSDEHKQITAEVAERAGFGKVGWIAEPLGALAFHLAKNDLTAGDATKGVVVVDFGGGTLDVALVDARGLREPWGDPTLGGRLFDDLFYQWMLDQNPGLTIDPVNVMYVWQVVCREVKEAFSNRWAMRGATDDFQTVVRLPDRTCRFKGASVAEFVRRAESYRPSEVALTYFQGLGAVPVGLAGPDPVDLLAWIRQTLAPDRRVPLRQGAYARVLLTGGSSAWPFMRDFAAEVFGVERDQLICSAQPEVAIGSGLALYNVLCRHWQRACVSLSEEKPERAETFELAVKKRLKAFAEDVARAVIDPLMAEIEMVFVEWHRSGGSLAAVEERVGTLCNSFEMRAEGLVGGSAESLSIDVLRLLRDHLQTWLTEPNIRREVDRFVPDRPDIAALDAIQEPGLATDIAGEVTLAVAVVLGGLMGVIVTGLMESGVISLMIVNPVIGGIVALLALVLISFGVGFFGAKVGENFVKQHNWGCLPLKLDLRVMRLRLSEQSLRQQLAERKTAVMAQLAADIEGETAVILRQAVQAFEKVIDQVIQDLGVLEQIRMVAPL